MKKFLLISCLLTCTLLLFGCSSGSNTSAQSRTDLTAEHFQGLDSDMKRKDVEGLVGTHDSALSDKEDIAVYSLSDGTTAILHYVDDTLAAAYIRGKDLMHSTIFNRFAPNEADNNASTDETSDPLDETQDSNDGTLDTEDNVLPDNGMMDTPDSIMPDTILPDGNYDTENGEVIGGDESTAGDDNGLMGDILGESESESAQ